MFSELVRAIEHGTDIVLLTAGLLRLCREHLAELHRLDCEPGIWREREALRRRCEDLFTAVDDEELDPEELEELRDIALEHSQKLPGVVIAHTIAEAVDLVLGSRFLPMFMGRAVVLAPGDPVPVPHPDWRRLAGRAEPLGASFSDAWNDDDGDRLDATAHLGLADDWAGQVRVTLDGNWRRWHVMPQLDSGDRLACATPNRSLAELVMERDQAADTPVFFDARWGHDSDEQLRRCLALLDLARDHGCRLVAFPELSVTESARPAIAQWLEAQSVVDLVVAGSSHRPAGQDRWDNEAAVYLRGLATPIVQRKCSPLALPDPIPGPGDLTLRKESERKRAPERPYDQRVVRLEHLPDSMPELRAQLSPHWTMVVLVNADAVADAVPDALVGVRANLVLVPAIAFAVDDFRALAAALAVHCQAVTMVANACVAGNVNVAGELDREPELDPGRDRPPVVIGLPSRPGAVIAVAPPPRSLLVVTLGSPGNGPAIVASSDAT